MDILSKDDPTAMPNAFKAEIIKTRRDHRDLVKVRFSFFLCRNSIKTKR